MDLSNGKVIGIGRETEGLYILKKHTEPVIGAVVGDKADHTLWHYRLGHASVGSMNHIPYLKNKVGIGTQQDCMICPLAKQCRLKFPLSSSQSHNMFDLVHLDVWGPHKQSTYDGKHYFVTVVDDYSRFTWITLLQSKRDVVVVLKNFISMICNQFGTGIKILRSDNGTEFFNSQVNELLLNSGIIHQSSCPYTPQQNGVVERKHRHILEMGRALKLQSGIPGRFWGECVKTAVYLINRLPTPVLNGKSPFELLHGKTPFIEHLKVFGCLCFANVLPKGDKFSARAKQGVLLGYSSTQKGYRLLDWETKAVFISRDVTFKEHIFPFKGIQAEDAHLPLLSPFVNDADIVKKDMEHCDDPVISSGGENSTPDRVVLNHESTDMVGPRLDSDIHVDQSEELGLVDSNIHVDQSEELGLVENTPHSNPLPPQVSGQRRTTRSSKPPIWTKDYVVPSKFNPYSITNHVSYVHLPCKYQSYLSAFSSITEPQSFTEASQDERWMTAMQQEIFALEDNNTWTIVDLPKGEKAIGSKWVYKIKYKANGEIDRFKARLVAKGYTQREGLDYHETFSPVAKMVTVRTLISIAASNGWSLFQMDVNNAFLQGDLHEDVYMELPRGFHRQGENKVCKLEKSLYGLKQASRQWNIKLTDALLHSGYSQSMHDHSLFTKRQGAHVVVILVYVDDLLITGSSGDLIKEAKLTLHQHFKMKDLGDLRYFLGIEVLKSREGILLNQRKYALQLISDAGLSGAKPASTPLEFNHKFTSLDYDKQIGATADPEFDDITAYQKLVGKLLYLTITRPDICFGVQVLSQFMQQPKVSHWEAALRIIRYVKKSPGLGVLLKRGNITELTGYCDSDWASCPNTRRSVTGYVVKLGDSLISWKSKKQQTVSRSSAEAEYRSMAAVLAELIWLAGLLKELGVSITMPIKVFSDSKAAIQIAANPIFHERTKHIEIDCHFIRERVKSGFIAPQYLCSRLQLADLLTKGLGAGQHDELLSKLGVLDVFHPPP